MTTKNILVISTIVLITCIISVALFKEPKENDRIKIDAIPIFTVTNEKAAVIKVDPGQKDNVLFEFIIDCHWPLGTAFVHINFVNTNLEKPEIVYQDTISIGMFSSKKRIVHGTIYVPPQYLKYANVFDVAAYNYDQLLGTEFNGGNDCISTFDEIIADKIKILKHFDLPEYNTLVVVPRELPPLP